LEFDSLLTNKDVFIDKLDRVDIAVVFVAGCLWRAVRWLCA